MPSTVLGGGLYRELMTERVRVAAELSAFNYAARFGYPGRTLGDYLADFGGWDGYVDDPFGTRP